MLKHFAELLKFKLSATVVFSAIVGYLLGFDNFDIHHFLYLILGPIEGIRSLLLIAGWYDFRE